MSNVTSKVQICQLRSIVPFLVTVGVKLFRTKMCGVTFLERIWRSPILSPVWIQSWDSLLTIPKYPHRTTWGEYGELYPTNIWHPHLDDDIMIYHVVGKKWTKKWTNIHITVPTLVLLSGSVPPTSERRCRKRSVHRPSAGNQQVSNWEGAGSESYNFFCYRQYGSFSKQDWSLIPPLQRSSGIPYHQNRFVWRQGVNP